MIALQPPLLNGIKYKSTRQHCFIPIICSTNELICCVCEKPLNSIKMASLQCDACESNVHECCKSEIQPCTKTSSLTCEPTPMSGHNRIKSDGASSINLDNESKEIIKHENDDAALNQNEELCRSENNVMLKAQAEDTTPSSSTTHFETRSMREESAPPMTDRPTSSRRFDIDDKIDALLNEKEWHDLDLFGPEPEPLAVTHSVLAKSLSKDDRKSQDIIFELYKIQRGLCQNVAIAKVLYHDTLRYILDRDTLSCLLPNDCFPPLIEFHFGFLKMLKDERDRGPIFHEYNELLQKAFSLESRERRRVVAVHVKLGSMFNGPKEMRITYLHHKLMGENQAYANFMKKMASQRVPGYNDRHTLIECLTKISLHATRYTALMDSLKKYDKSEECAITIRLMKQLPTDINAGVEEEVFRLKWDEMKLKLDHTSMAKCNGRPFSMRDLTSFTERQLRYVKEIKMRSVIKMINCEMWVFDDILVFLKEHTSTRMYTFCSLDKHEAVLPLEHLIVREVSDRDKNGIFLVKRPPAEPDIIEIRVDKAKDIEKVKEAIDRAHEEASSLCLKVRRLNDDEQQQAKLQLSTDKKTDYWIEWDAWLNQLKGLFESREEAEMHFGHYLCERVEWFDTIKELLEEQLPHMLNNLAGVGSTKDISRRREELITKVSNLLKNGLHAVRSTRKTAMAKAVQKVENMQKDEWQSIFDDLLDAGVTGRSSSGSDESSGSTKTRRIKTFNGKVDEGQDKSEMRNSSSADLMRRHTTVPPLVEHVKKSDDSSDAEQPNDMKLTLIRQRRAQRRNVSWIAKENMQLLSLCNSLKSRCAALETELAIERQRREDIETKSRGVMNRPNPETLEQLRKLQRKINEESKIREEKLNIWETMLHERESEFQQRESNLAKAEREIEEKWMAIKSKQYQFGNYATAPGVRHSSNSPRRPSLSALTAANLNGSLTNAELNFDEMPINVDYVFMPNQQSESTPKEDSVDVDENGNNPFSINADEEPVTSLSDITYENSDNYNNPPLPNSPVPEPPSHLLSIVNETRLPVTSNSSQVIPVNLRSNTVSRSTSSICQATSPSTPSLISSGLLTSRGHLPPKLNEPKKKDTKKKEKKNKLI